MINIAMADALLRKYIASPRATHLDSDKFANVFSSVSNRWPLGESLLDVL